MPSGDHDLMVQKLRQSQKNRSRLLKILRQIPDINAPNVITITNYDDTIKFFYRHVLKSFIITCKTNKMSVILCLKNWCSFHPLGNLFSSFFHIEDWTLNTTI